jgi:hypothetical protein
MILSEMCDNGEKKRRRSNYQASAAKRGRHMHSDGA